MNRDQTTALIDNLLKIIVSTSVFAAALVLPNLLVAFDRPLAAYLRGFDKRAGEREMRRIIRYMKAQDLVKGGYDHGLTITGKGRARLAKSELDKLSVPRLTKWDKKWRMILFDIPESQKSGRNALTAKLKSLDFHQLQRSVWIHPFPCRNIIEKIADFYNVSSCVTYIETSHIDNQQKLIDRFKKILDQKT